MFECSRNSKFSGRLVFLCVFVGCFFFLLAVGFVVFGGVFFCCYCFVLFCSVFFSLPQLLGSIQFGCDNCFEVLGFSSNAGPLVPVSVTALQWKAAARKKVPAAVRTSLTLEHLKHELE